MNWKSTNKFIIAGDKVLIEIGNKYATVDIEHLELVKQYSWYLLKGYVNTDIRKSSSIFSYKTGSKMSLHRLVMGTNVTNTLHVDHIDGDKLQNTSTNLRLVTRSQNLMNSKIYKCNKTGIAGVNVHKCGKWVAYIRVNNKQKHLGLFTNIEDAIKARQEAETKYFGEYANKGER